MFGRSSASKTGLQSWCRACFKLENSSWRSKNKKYCQDRGLAYNAKNAEKIKQYSAEHYLKNRSNRTRQISEWQRNNKERKLELDRMFWARHPEKRLAKEARRRSNLFGFVIHKISQSDLNRMLFAYNKRCAYCYCDLSSIRLHWDHVIPVSKGGAHCLSNLRPSCQTCNLSKGSKNLHSWLKSKEMTCQVPSTHA